VGDPGAERSGSDDGDVEVRHPISLVKVWGARKFFHRQKQFRAKRLGEVNAADSFCTDDKAPSRKVEIDAVCLVAEVIKGKVAVAIRDDLLLLVIGPNFDLHAW
jgi:hypothetical protein